MQKKANGIYLKSLLYLYKTNIQCNMNSLRFLSLILILSILGSFSFQKVDYRRAMHKNVCKDLHNSVLMYFIFVDTKTTAPWTEFDIRTTLDSIAVAKRWLMEQAKKIQRISINSNRLLYR